MICVSDKRATFPGNASEEKPEVTITEAFFFVFASLQRPAVKTATVALQTNWLCCLVSVRITLVFGMPSPLRLNRAGGKRHSGDSADEREAGLPRELWCPMALL